MIILIAADWRFKTSAVYLKESAERFGYKVETYDLGNLGYGLPYDTRNDNFINNGYYCVANEIIGWKSKGWHKPNIILECLKTAKETVVYMDADTVLLSPIDEITGSYDIGVTVRRSNEGQARIGSINAGVVFFNPGSIDLVRAWVDLTVGYSNDQKALNELYQRHKYRFKTFPTDIYNYYYFDEGLGKAKILHFKGDYQSKIEEFIRDQRRQRII
jgi:hypothetical protein